MILFRILLLTAFMGVVHAEPPVVPPHQSRTVEVSLPSLPKTARLRVVPGGPRETGRAPLPVLPRAWGWGTEGPWIWDGGRRWVWEAQGWRQSGAFLPLAAGTRLGRGRLEGAQGRWTLPFSPLLIAADGDHACLAGEDGRIVWVALGPHPRPVGETRRPEPLRALGAWSQGCVILDAEGWTEVLFGEELTPTARLRGNGPGESLVVAEDRIHLVDRLTGYTLYALTPQGEAHWLGSQNKLGGLVAVAAAGPRVLVADERGTVHLLDVSRPDTPRPLTAIYLGDDALHGLVWYQGGAMAVGRRQAHRLDFSDQGAPPISDLGINLGGSRRGRVVGDLLYVADWFSGLHIYDIRQPQAPRLVGNLRTPGSTKGIWVERGYAFIADDDQGLQVADVSDPTHPRRVAHLPLRGLAYTFDRGEDVLYLAAHRGGVHLLDIEDPTKPRLLGSYDTPGKAWAVRVRGRLAYVADDDHGLLVLDVSDPRHPRLVTTLEDLCRAEDLHLYHDLLYVACFDAGLKVLDLSDPRNPNPVAHLPTPGNARGLFRVGERLYLADWEAGVHVLDLSDPRHPRPLGRYDTRGAAWGVLVRGPIAYALDWWGGIQAIDFSDPAVPRLVGRYQGRGRIHGLRRYPGGYVFAAAGSGGLHVYDVKNPLNPIWGGGVESSGPALDVAADPGRHLAVVAAGDDGLALFDVQQPLAPRWLARVDLPHKARRVVTIDHWAWVVGADGLSRVDLSDPLRPRVTAVRPGHYLDLAGDGRRLLVLDSEGRIWVCGVKNTTDGCAEGPLISRPDAYRLAIEGDRLIVAEDARVTIFDTHGRLLGMFPFTGRIAGMSLYEGRLFLSRGAVVTEVDLFDPAHPRLVSEYPAPHPLGSLAVDGTAILAGGGAVLLGGERLPPIPLHRLDGGRVAIQVPSGLPMGSYDLIAEGEAGQIQRFPAVFRVALPPPPKKKKFTLEDLQRVLRSGHFPGRADVPNQ